MTIIGIDLSGPSNIADTAMVIGRADHSFLQCVGWQLGVGDAEILEAVEQANNHGAVSVGIDAPLSYNPGGGLRPADKQLKLNVTGKGMLHASSVMPPTLNRMAYLTLRGITVARMLESINKSPRIVEVHPGSAMALRGAPIDAVKAFKGSKIARQELLDWLSTQGISNLCPEVIQSDHLLAGYAAVLATWNWACKKPVWCYPAEPPTHPYDFAV